MSTDLVAGATPTAQWAKQRSESAPEFDAFSQWLALAPRPAPSQCGEGIGELAARNDWLGRAQAYDAACDMLRVVPDGRPSGLVGAAVEMWTQAVFVESRKMLDSVLSSKGRVLDNATLNSFLVKFVELSAVFGARQQEYDMSDLTQDEIAQLIRLQSKVKVK